MSMVVVVLGRQLVAVIEKTRDVMNVWLGEKTFKMLAPDIPMVKSLERKAIGKKLREENKEIRNGKRYPKYWEQSKVTEFIFNIVEVAEAESLVKNGIKWQGKPITVSVLRKGELGRQKTPFLTKVGRQKKREEAKKKGPQVNKTPFSFMICNNCRGKGHTMKNCTSASRAVSKKIKRRAESADKGKKKGTIIDEDRFTKVVNIQKTSNPTPEPAPKIPIPEPRIVELVLDWNKVKAAKTKAIVEKVEQDG